MSNETNLEDNTVYTDDGSQLTHHDESEVMAADSEYESNDDAVTHETVIVPGDSEYDTDYDANSESPLEDSQVFDYSAVNSDDETVTDSEELTSENLAESESIESEPEEVPATPVDITILNEDYTIFCPQGEEDELFQATGYINDFIDGIREDAPMLSQKNLLVLACLNLYEKMKQAQVAAQSDEETLQHASRLVDQMIDDMQLED